MENIEITKTNKVYLKGSLDRFLKEWLRNEYIIEKVKKLYHENKKSIDELNSEYEEKNSKSEIEYQNKKDTINEEYDKKCKELTNDCREKLFSHKGVKFFYKNGAVSGYFIPSMKIAFEIMENYDPYSKDKKTQRIFMQKDNLFLTEEQIKELFIENKKVFNIKGLSEEKATVSKLFKKKTLLVKCKEDGAVNIISGEHSENDKGAIYIPCCSLTEEEFLNGLYKQDYTNDIVDEYKSKLEKLKQEKEIKQTKLSEEHKNELTCYETELSENTRDENQKLNNISKILNETTPDKSEITKDNIKEKLDEFSKKADKLYEFYKDCKNCFEESEIEEAYRKRLESNNQLDEVETLLVLLGAKCADTYRAGIHESDWGDFYEKGHWELFPYKEKEDGTEVILNEEYPICNPVDECKDITHEVGIDFGTTSTVVSFRDDNNDIKFIRIGSTDFNTKINDKDYENPTVIELIDYKKFKEDYDCFAGRPHTSNADLKVSHEAKKDLNEKSKESMSSFLNDIKQWCGDDKATRGIGLEDQKGYEIHLKPFKNFDSDDFDPVEIYAYRLGLSINNVHNGGFYLKYLMSFPTTYEKAVREKMLASFEKGLKKSLPEAVLNDKETMNKFSVKAQYSEPAAYALCALQKFRITPKENEKILYSVFDFGGGTTDIVFGIWRKADKKKRNERNYDYAIEPFKEVGDRYLGGEYLLELLAYEVFKDNKDKLTEDNAVYRFSKPEESKDFSGSERLVKNGDTISRHNMLQVEEELRYLWEGITEYNTKDLAKEDEYNICGYRIKKRPELSFIENGNIKVKLRSSNDTNKENLKDVTLEVDSKKLIKFLEDRIRIGIENYFEALKKVMENPKTSEFNTLHLFFAGNSCKSPILYKVFDEYKNNEWKSEKISDIIIHHPLGTYEANQEIDKLKATGVIEEVSSENYEPTGKSGVAYGLLQENVKVTEEISWEDEAQFKSYLGIIENNKFKVIIDRDEEYNKWHTFGDPDYGYGCPADIDYIIIYYTSSPIAMSGELDKSKVKRVVAHIENPDENKDFYIRKKTPDTIEYGIGEMCNEEDGSFNEESIESLGELKLNP